MQFLRNLIEKQKTLYHGKDSRFHKLWPAFDALETFLFAPEHRADRTGTHVRDYVDLKRVMNTVIVAMLPCLLWAIWNTGAQHFHAVAQMVQAGKMTADGYVGGWLQSLFVPTVAAPTAMDNIVYGLQRMLPILIVSYGVGLGIEMVFSIVRKEEVSEGYLVSGMLIALIVPTSIPLWQLACGVAFAVVLGKEVFGGTGMNIFNPAMLCRAFLFFAFPAQLSGDSVWVSGNNASHLIDGYSSPTALAIVKPQTVTDASATLAQHFSHADLFFGNIPGSAGEMSKLCVLLGAFWLVFTGVGSWRVMLAGVLGLLGASLAMHALLPASYGGPVTLQAYEHLIAGGFLFGIVYMATDPVSSPETNRGKWIYGALIGVVTILVRTINPAYPEGTMLSILLLNAFAPTIDHFVVGSNIKRRLAR
ncbi:MAG: NADH:ubiquinone reductase (Na(+)-transporting) subunit B [Planctomycetes bacterium]|nr:NADH:ubiquinone reductase (Na(+)-transporting) subunit B [Planctomycetota bacterium]